MQLDRFRDSSYGYFFVIVAARRSVGTRSVPNMPMPKLITTEDARSLYVRTEQTNGEKSLVLDNVEFSGDATRTFVIDNLDRPQHAKTHRLPMCAWRRYSQG